MNTILDCHQSTVGYSSRLIRPYEKPNQNAVDVQKLHSIRTKPEVDWMISCRDMAV